MRGRVWRFMANAWRLLLVLARQVEGKTPAGLGESLGFSAPKGGPRAKPSAPSLFERSGLAEVRKEPPRRTGDSRSYCFVAFVHSSATSKVCFRMSVASTSQKEPWSDADSVAVVANALHGVSGGVRHDLGTSVLYLISSPPDSE